MADVAAEGEFDLVYVVFNTFFAMLTQDDQVRCFANVAARLKPDGAFVIQAFVPDLTRFERGQRVQARDLDADGVRIDASMHDPLPQTVRRRADRLGRRGCACCPSTSATPWPSELDLMAQLAGPAAARALRELRAPAVHGGEPEPRLGVRAPRQNGRLKIARRSTICTSW